MTRSIDPGTALGARGVNLRLSTFYAGYFLVGGVLWPFWPLFLSGRGLDADKIGLVLAVALWVRSATGPLVARFADRTGDTRGPLLTCAVGALAIMVVFFWTTSFWPLLLATVAFHFAYSTVGPLGETIALRSVSAHRGYGRVRLWGSATFILTATGGGYVLEARGGVQSDTIVMLMLVTLVVMVVGSAVLPDARGPRAASGAGPIWSLVRNRAFLLFLAATGLIQAAHTVYYGFSTIHWAAAGHSKGTIGLLWAEGVVAEILLFAFGGGLVKRLGPVNLFIIAALGGLVRWAVLALTTELWALVLVQALHAATFGAAHLGSMLFITRAVPGAFANSAQSLYASVTHGAVLGVGFLLAGVLYESYGASAYWWAAATSALAVPVALWLARAGRTDERVISDV